MYKLVKNSFTSFYLFRLAFWTFSCRFVHGLASLHLKKQAGEIKMILKRRYLLVAVFRFTNFTARSWDFWCRFVITSTEHKSRHTFLKELKTQFDAFLSRESVFYKKLFKLSSAGFITSLFWRNLSINCFYGIFHRYSWILYLKVIIKQFHPKSDDVVIVWGNFSGL